MFYPVVEFFVFLDWKRIGVSIFAEEKTRVFGLTALEVNAIPRARSVSILGLGERRVSKNTNQ